MKYSIDTSSLIDAAVRWYPRDVFPSVWKRIDELFDSGVIVATEEVRHEILRKEDSLKTWATARSRHFIAHSDEVQQAVRIVINRFRLIVDQSPGKSFGDPFVVAVAQVHNLTVVTGERTGSSGRPRIPFMCQELGIRCINTLGLLRAEGLSF